MSQEAVDRFRAAGEALYGSQWQTELARALGISTTSGQIRKMARGAARITPKTWAMIGKLMEQRRRDLAMAIPKADRDNASILRVREILRHGTRSEAGACLVGLGWTELGLDMMAASEMRTVAQRRFDALEMRDATSEEIAENPFLAATGVPADQDLYNEVSDEMAHANAEMARLDHQARLIADSLDCGGEGDVA